MDSPKLYYQESSTYPDEVAIMMSFIPTFIYTEPQDFIVEEDTKFEVEDIPAYNNLKNFYIFIVDRSGSMDGVKMNITNKALLLFFQSLPEDSKFEIISFGSSF